MTVLKAVKPSGFRDYLPDEMRIINNLIFSFRLILQSYGFEPMQTPAAEFNQILMSKYGENATKQIFNIEKNKSDESLLSLRYDQTVPLMRFLAENRDDIRLPFKRYQVGQVWRSEKPQAGRYREFTQLDVDIIGVRGIAAEADLITIISECLDAVKITDYEIQINSRSAINALFSIFQYDGIDVKNIYRIIDKYNENDYNEIIQDMMSVVQNIDISEMIYQLIYKNSNEVLEKHLLNLKESDRSAYYNAMNNIKTLYDQIGWRGGNTGNIIYKPSMIRGLDYYTDIIFEIKMKNGYDLSLGGGGRYDGLFNLFSDENLPCCGFAFGIDRMAQVVQTTQINDMNSITNVYIIPMNENCIKFSLDLAKILRQEAINTDVYEPEKGINLKERLGWCDHKKIPFVVIIGENELLSNTITIKDMKARTDIKKINIKDGIDFLLENV